MLSDNKKKIGLLLIVTSMVLLSGCSFLSGDSGSYEQNASENILTQEQASESITGFEVQRTNTLGQIENSSNYEGVNITSTANVNFSLINNSTPNNNSVYLIVGMLNTSDVDTIEKAVNKEEDISYSYENTSKWKNVGDNSLVTKYNESVSNYYVGLFQKNNMYITVFADMHNVDNSREVLGNIVKKQFEVAE